MDGGGSLRALDAAQWARPAAAPPAPVSTWVVRSRAGAGAAGAGCAGARGGRVVAFWHSGGRPGGGALVPQSLEQRLGDATLEWLDGELTRPTGNCLPHNAATLPSGLPPCWRPGSVPHRPAWPHRPHRHLPPTSCIFARAASAPMRLRCPAEPSC